MKSLLTAAENKRLRHLQTKSPYANTQWLIKVIRRYQAALKKQNNELDLLEDQMYDSTKKIMKLSNNINRLKRNPIIIEKQISEK